ncbi:MAG: permease-like cell division protein FtsX [Legionellaceae bacterium]|nr:permease-like cell division protein FtsX [Legionellaceae bacterium]
MKSFHAWLDFHKQAAKGSVIFLKKEPLATFMTIFVIAIILVLSSIFWILSDAMQNITVNWQSTKQISLYLDVPSMAVAESDLMAKVLSTKGVASASIHTSAEALKILQAQSGMHDILSYLPSNPLPSVIDVIPDAQINTQESLDNLYQTLKEYPSVAEAKLDLEWINSVFTFLGFISKFLHLLMIILAVALVLIIGNTLRLIINDRQEEIMVLRFIGASDRFIMRPYLYSGVYYGAFAAILAILLVNIIFMSLQSEINSLLYTYKIHYNLDSLSLLKTGVMLLTASILGWFGARISVKSHLMKTF